MTLPNGDGGGVVALRLEAAQRAIEDARLLIGSGSIRGAVNRAYYAMFYAASALALSNNSGTCSIDAEITSAFLGGWHWLSERQDGFPFQDTPIASGASVLDDSETR